MTTIWQKFASLFCCVVLYFLLLVFLSVNSSANAHEVRPAIVDFKSQSDGGFELSIKFNAESWLARIEADHEDTDASPNAAKYDQLRAASSAHITRLFEEQVSEFLGKAGIEFDDVPYAITFMDIQVPSVGDIDLARDSVARFSGNVPTGVAKIVWRYDLGASVFRVSGQGNEKASLYVAADEKSEAVSIFSPQKQSAFSSFVTYIGVGFEHIIPKGLDHILFVVGLFLLSTRLRPLLWQITSFTVAHTVTLGLGMVGVISIPANIVEPLIAASIIYVAVENIFMDRLSPWRPVVVFFFGLLHGLGFAGVLRDFGLESDNFVAGLIGFNVGVELGQLSVIAGCFLLVGFWFGRKDWYHARVTIPGSVMIALAGGWWFYERVF